MLERPSVIAGPQEAREVSMRYCTVVWVLCLVVCNVAEAQTPTKEVWACVTEHMAGIEERDDGKVVAGNYKLDPERFLLTLEGIRPKRRVVLSPVFTSAFDEEEEEGGLFPLTGFRQKVGYGLAGLQEQGRACRKIP